MSSSGAVPSAATLANMPPTATDSPVLQKEKHISYWLRCLRTPLPHQYTSNDSNRMSLAFFTLSALDLLGALDTRTTPAERREYADWIYSCQHLHGGFRSCPAMDFSNRANADNAGWDPAGVPATFFALVSLAILKDDFSRVKRQECLQWLCKMQRPDGSFGEMLGDSGKIEGGMDTRFGHCASGVRWILTGGGSVGGGTTSGGGPATDVDIDGLVRCIDSFKTYDGGISQGAFNEGHAGLTYCAIGALYFIGRLSHTPAMTVKWLLARLTTDIDEDESDESDQEEDAGVEERALLPSYHEQDPKPSFEKLSSRPVDSQTAEILSRPGGDDPQMLTPTDIMSINWVGLNGRSNKLADTCYVFWVAASLALLDSLHLTPVILIRKYLLEKTQHLVLGGFGKLPGALPDLYHAYLGLAALSLLGTADRDSAESSSAQLVKPLDPALCISVDARAWIEALSWRSTAGSKQT